MKTATLTVDQDKTMKPFEMPAVSSLLESAVSRFDDIERELALTKTRMTKLKDKAFQEKVFKQLDSHISDRCILSLDIFDTLLLRDGSSELTRFIEIGERMAERAGNIRPIDAFLARYLGTKATYRAGSTFKGCREGSLTEIHRTASRLLGCRELSEAFIDIELDYETKRLSINPLIIKYLQLHRNRGGRVILISDMYMHGDQIAILLNKMGLALELFDQIFSSADHKVSKASAGIFSIVEEAYNLSSDHFMHVGDSLLGDFQQPLRKGWNALRLPIPANLISERRMDHLSAALNLSQRYGVTTDIAVPR